jgi:hypothetical protein
MHAICIQKLRWDEDYPTAKQKNSILFCDFIVELLTEYFFQISRRRHREKLQTNQVERSWARFGLHRLGWDQNTWNRAMEFGDVVRDLTGSSDRHSF